MEERFDLAPWELAPDSPEKLEGVASGRVRASWLGEEREYLLREVEIAPKRFIVFAREVGSDDEGNWLLHYAHKSSWISLYTRGANRTYNNEDLGLKLEALGVARLIWTSIEAHGNSLPYCATFNSEGQGCFQRPSPFPIKPEVTEWLPFSYDASGLASANCDDWKRRFESELNTSDSDVNFSLYWANLTFQQRADAVINFRHGYYSQLIQIMTWVLLSDSGISWTTFPWCWRFCFLENHDSFWQHIWNSNWEAGSFNQQDTSCFCNLWREGILGWFGVSINKRLIKAHYCVDRFCGEKDGVRLMQVEVSPPTQHERLEARLQLRDWARGKVPDELLKTLS